MEVFTSMNTMEVNETRNCLVTDILSFKYQKIDWMDSKMVKLKCLTLRKFVKWAYFFIFAKYKWMAIC